MTTTPLTPSQATAWRNAIFVIFAMPGLAMATWVSRLPAVRDALEIRIDQVGILIFAMAVGSIAGLLLSSHIIAFLGAKKTIIAGTIVLSIGVTVAGLGATVGPVFAVTWIGLFVLGFSSGITDVAMNISGAANERVIGKSIMPVFHAFFSFGTLAGAGLGALAQAIELPIAIHFGLAALVMLVGVLTVIRFVQSESILDGSSSTDEKPAGGWRERLAIWRDPRTVLIGIVVLSASFAEGSANDWITLAMVDGHHVDKTTGALVFGVFVTAMTVGRLVGVVLLDRFGRVPVLRSSFALAAIGLLVMIFVPNPAVAAVGAVAWGLGAALGFPVGMSAAADDPAKAAARVSAVATIGYLAFLAGPPIIGFLGEAVGILNALLVVLVLCAVGGLLSYSAREPEKKKQAETDTFIDPGLPSA